jgi:hypothetical protein
MKNAETFALAAMSGGRFGAFCLRHSAFMLPP